MHSTQTEVAGSMCMAQTILPQFPHAVMAGLEQM